MFRSGFSEKKLKVNLRLVINRLKLIEKKKTELAMKERKDIAEYLKLNKTDRARIRVEHIIREDYLVEAMEIVEMYADILMARIGLMTISKSLDESLKKPVSSLIWVSMRMRSQCEELAVVHNQLGAYYGKEYMRACECNEVGTVCEKLMHKLDPKPPPRKLVEKYLIEIAKAHSVDFTPDETALNENSFDPQAIPCGLTEEELISFYDKNVPPGPPRGPPKGPPGNFGGGGGGNFYYPPQMGATANAPALPPNQPAAYPGNSSVTLPPYSATDPNSPNCSVTVSYIPPDDQQAPPLPSKNPAGSPEKIDLSVVNEHGYNLNEHLKPNIQPPTQPVAAPRSISPNIPELPSVPSSFCNSKPGDDENSNDNEVDFDDLTKRFENLKKKK